MNLVRSSKFISLVLRHEPKRAGLTLDSAGWARVSDLLRGMAAAGHRITREQLESIVEENDKKRFAFSADGQSIRANQGHSVAVELDYEPVTPPDILFHGTADRFLDSILARGLDKAQRHHVHLSAERSTAISVGGRHGRPVVLQVRAAAMHAAGHEFFQSDNGVWLTAHVPAAFLSVDAR